MRRRRPDYGPLTSAARCRSSRAFCSFSVPDVVLRGLAILLAVAFCLDGLGRLLAANLARRDGAGWWWLAMTAVANICLALMLVTRWPIEHWSARGFRGRLPHADRRMVVAARPARRAECRVRAGPDARRPGSRLAAPPDFRAAERDGECPRRKSVGHRHLVVRHVDCRVFRHPYGAMRVYWNLVGMVAPLAAVAGDLAVALDRRLRRRSSRAMAWCKLTRPLERRGWLRCFGSAGGRGTGDARPAESRMVEPPLALRAGASRGCGTRHAPPSLGAMVGLPITAVWISIQPIFGELNYFFNSENWSSIVWHRWAETQTDR